MDTTKIDLNYMGGRDSDKYEGRVFDSRLDRWNFSLT
jgi:hypothetical protein